MNQIPVVKRFFILRLKDKTTPWFGIRRKAGSSGSKLGQGFTQKENTFATRASF